MLEQICKEIRNFFCQDEDKHFGEFTITGGVIALDFLKTNQYFRIVGSVFNDGVYKYTGSAITDLTDETFDGAIWAMSVPPALIALASEISTWQTANKDSARSPYTSESFGGYTYQKRTGNNGSCSWKDAFRSELNEWRKI